LRRYRLPAQHDVNPLFIYNRPGASLANMPSIAVPVKSSFYTKAMLAFNYRKAGTRAGFSIKVLLGLLLRTIINNRDASNNSGDGNTGANNGIYANNGDGANNGIYANDAICATDAICANRPFRRRLWRLMLPGSAQLAPR
jgi:hypothetical protein